MAAALHTNNAFSSRFIGFVPVLIAGGNSNNNDNSESSKGICRTLEVAFRKVWLRLYTSGPDENYSLALKEFVQVPACLYDVLSAAPLPLAASSYP